MHDAIMCHTIILHDVIPDTDTNSQTRTSPLWCQAVHWNFGTPDSRVQSPRLRASVIHVHAVRQAEWEKEMERNLNENFVTSVTLSAEPPDSKPSVLVSEVFTTV